jgi:hypothetical protein
VVQTVYLLRGDPYALRVGDDASAETTYSIVPNLINSREPGPTHLPNPVVNPPRICLRATTYRRTIGNTERNTAAIRPGTLTPY